MLDPRLLRQAVDLPVVGVGRFKDPLQADRALIALLAKTFRVPKSGIEIVAGESARLKQVRIAGDPSALAAIVNGWMQSGESL